MHVSEVKLNDIFICSCKVGGGILIAGDCPTVSRPHFHMQLGNILYLKSPSNAGDPFFRVNPPSCDGNQTMQWSLPASNCSFPATKRSYASYSATSIGKFWQGMSSRTEKLLEMRKSACACPVGTLNPRLAECTLARTNFRSIDKNARLESAGKYAYMDMRTSLCLCITSFGLFCFMEFKVACYERSMRSMGSMHHSRNTKQIKWGLSPNSAFCSHGHHRCGLRFCAGSRLTVKISFTEVSTCESISTPRTRIAISTFY
jgi:hypothetical protein